MSHDSLAPVAVQSYPRIALQCVVSIVSIQLAVSLVKARGEEHLHPGSAEGVVCHRVHGMAHAST